LIIRPPNLEDGPFIFQLLNSENWIKYIGDRNVKNEEQAREYIKNKIFPQLKKFGYSNNTVIRKSDLAKIGSCGIYHREGMDNPDLGFAFLPQFERQGYGTESAKKVLEIGTDEFLLKQIDAITTKNNIPSQKLLVKLGFELMGDINLPNDPEELFLYSFYSSE